MLQECYTADYTYHPKRIRIRQTFLHVRNQVALAVGSPHWQITVATEQEMRIQVNWPWQVLMAADLDRFALKRSETNRNAG